MSTAAAKQKNHEAVGGAKSAITTPPPAVPVPPIPPTENVDKIRDILFGASMRDYDKRFTRLEEKLIKESSDIRDEIRKRLADLENYIRQEVESLSERMLAEVRARTELGERLSADVSELGKTLEKRAQSIEDQHTKGQRDLRQQLLDQGRQTAAEIAASTEALAQHMERALAELRNEKTDRAALAGLFTEVAMRLRNEFSFPGAEASTDAAASR